MRKFETFDGIVAPIDRPNIDTDAIIPKQYLKSIKRSGFGINLFDDWRYLDPGEPGQDHRARRLNPDFVLNRAPYDHAHILLARENFACGSSREHAVWALLDFGIKVVIAPSFADIFYNNSFKNGLLPVALDSALEIDLERQVVVNPAGVEMSFEIDAFRKYCLLHGFDDIGLTMQHADEIRGFEQQYYARLPWLQQG